jgi:ADP-heptose:LPS heptosyltransferase
MSRIFVDTSENGASFGLGDSICFIPALRALREKHPHDEIVLVTYFAHINVFAYCDFVDYVLPLDFLNPGDWTYGYNVSVDERFNIVNPKHTFLQHHKEHMAKANIRHMLLESPEGHSLDYELSIRDHDKEPIQKFKDDILKQAKDKPIVAICPSITMYSRMWPKQRWEELTKLLQKNKYFVVSIGHAEDFEIDVDYDARGKYPVHYIPKILDIFKSVILIDSGMLHVASINQKVHITMISTGRFPPEVIVPYRNGKWADNVTIIQHNCPQKEACFKEYASELSTNDHIERNLRKYQQENNKPFPPEESQLLLKYVCWNHCLREENKFICNTINAQDVYNAFKDKESQLVALESKGFPVYHQVQPTFTEDYKVWKETIFFKGAEHRTFIDAHEINSVELITAKVKIIKDLYPKNLLIVIARKDFVPMLKECADIYHTIPVEFIKNNFRIGTKDNFLRL